MEPQSSPQNQLKDIQISLKLKLATLWTSIMFLYIYTDHFHLFMPGTLKGLLAGKVFVFEITQAFLLIALATVTIPILMIFLSVALPGTINRRANIIIAAMYIPFTLFNLAGEAWMHMVFAAFVEVVLLCLIILYAWKWPRIGIENS